MADERLIVVGPFDLGSQGRNGRKRDHSAAEQR